MAYEHTFKMGAAYRNGKLYEFTRDCVIVMKGWPVMRAWQWTGEYARPWRHVRPRLKRISLRGLSRMPDPDSHPPEPNGQMLFPFAYSFVARNAYRAFWWAVPEAYRHLVMPFRDRRWHMLALLARCPGADDLAVSNPALAFCLASNWAFHKPAVCQPLRAARHLVYKKQRQILEWLGFPGTESTRQILCKIPPESMTVEFLAVVRGAIRSPEWSRPLGFMKRITEDVFRIITTPDLSAVATFSLLEEISQEPRPDRNTVMAFQIRDILRMGGVLSRKISRLRSVAQVNQLHDELAFDLNLRDTINGGALPPPPFPGVDGKIEPLETCRELMIEGREQHHCVASYADEVRCGHVYIYRMLKPERATLAIISRRGSWWLDDIRGCCNANVQPESLNTVMEWLRSHQSTDTGNQMVVRVQAPDYPNDLPF